MCAIAAARSALRSTVLPAKSPETYNARRAMLRLVYTKLVGTSWTLTFDAERSVWMILLRIHVTCKLYHMMKSERGRGKGKGEGS